jgi:hypothetical protein
MTRSSRGSIPQHHQDRSSSTAAILGGNRDDAATAITIDGLGRAFVAGSTGSNTFPTTANAFQPVAACSSCGKTFVSVIAADGRSLEYSTYLSKAGQANANMATGIALDPAGRVYVVGTDVYSDVFPTTPGVLAQAQHQVGFYAGYLVKLDVSAAGASSLVWGTLITDPPCPPRPNPCAQQGTYPAAIAVDANGFSYITGSAGCGYPMTAGVFDPSGTSMADCQNNYPFSSWVTKINQTASALVYSTRIGGHVSGSGSAIAIVGAGNACVTGFLRFGGAGFPISTQAANPSSASAKGFFAKVSPDAHNLLYSTYLEADATGAGITLDSAGNAYVQPAPGSRPWTHSALRPWERS